MQASLKICLVKFAQTSCVEIVTLLFLGKSDCRIIFNGLSQV